MDRFQTTETKLNYLPGTEAPELEMTLEIQRFGLLVHTLIGEASVPELCGEGLDIIDSQGLDLCVLFPSVMVDGKKSYLPKEDFEPRSVTEGPFQRTLDMVMNNKHTVYPAAGEPGTVKVFFYEVTEGTHKEEPLCAGGYKLSHSDERGIQPVVEVVDPIISPKLTKEADGTFALTSGGLLNHRAVTKVNSKWVENLSIEGINFGLESGKEILFNEVPETKVIKDGDTTQPIDITEFAKRSDYEKEAVRSHRRLGRTAAVLLLVAGVSGGAAATFGFQHLSSSKGSNETAAPILYDAHHDMASSSSTSLKPLETTTTVTTTSESTETTTPAPQVIVEYRNVPAPAPEPVPTPEVQPTTTTTLPPPKPATFAETMSYLKTHDMGDLVYGGTTHYFKQSGLNVIVKLYDLNTQYMANQNEYCFETFTYNQSTGRVEINNSPVNRNSVLSLIETDRNSGPVVHDAQCEPADTTFN